MAMANKARAPLDLVDPEAVKASRTGTLTLERKKSIFLRRLDDAVDRRTCPRAAGRVRK